MNVALGLVAFLAVLGLVQTLDADSAEVTAKIVAEVDDKRALPPEPIFSHPIKWDATVTQNGRDGIPRTRFYVRSGK